MLICRYACTLFVATLTAPVVINAPMAPAASALYTSQNTMADLCCHAAMRSDERSGTR
jgi:hypothetical protein